MGSAPSSKGKVAVSYLGAERKSSAAGAFRNLSARAEATLSEQRKLSRADAAKEEERRVRDQLRAETRSARAEGRPPRPGSAPSGGRRRNSFAGEVRSTGPVECNELGLTQYEQGLYRPNGFQVNRNCDDETLSSKLVGSDVRGNSMPASQRPRPSSAPSLRQQESNTVQASTQVFKSAIQASTEQYIFRNDAGWCPKPVTQHSRPSSASSSRPESRKSSKASPDDTPRIVQGRRPSSASSSRPDERKGSKESIMVDTTPRTNSIFSNDASASSVPLASRKTRPSSATSFFGRTSEPSGAAVASAQTAAAPRRPSSAPNARASGTGLTTNLRQDEAPSNRPSSAPRKTSFNVKAYHGLPSHLPSYSSNVPSGYIDSNHEKTMDDIVSELPGHGSDHIPNAKKTIRRTQTKSLSDRRPQSNMLRRRSSQCGGA